MPDQTASSRRGIPVCAAALALFLLLGLLRWPETVLAAGRRALALCEDTILPSLFPFFVLSSLVVGLGLADSFGRLLRPVMRPLFRVSGSGAAALVLGLIGGYPVGARTVRQLYEEGLISRADAVRLLAFCNNSGPAFLLGVVGSGVYGSAQIGLFLCAVHILAALLVGFCFRFYPVKGTERARSVRSARRETKSGAALFTDAVRSSFSAVLGVCAFLLFFGVVTALMEQAGAFGLLTGLLQKLGLPPELGRSLCAGVLELSNGIASLPNAAYSLPLAAALLGWGGVSVLCQTMGVLDGSGLPIQTCIWGKALHGALSALLCLAVQKLCPAAVPALAVQTAPLEQPPFLPRLCLWSALAAAVFLLLCIAQKRGGKVGSGTI